MLKFIQMRTEDDQRWCQVQNPMLSPRQHMSPPTGIQAVLILKTAYAMKLLMQSLPFAVAHGVVTA